MTSQDSGKPFHWHYAELDDKNFQLHGRGSILLVVVVFSLVIFFILLCLYAKWACRYRRLAAVAAASAQQELTLPATGLDRDTINGFPVHVRGPSADEAQCSICLCNVVGGEKVKVLPGCNHGFHTECVDEWLKSQSSCPLCRASLIAGPAQPEVSV